jgi:hypothetical protein
MAGSGDPSLCRERASECERLSKVAPGPQSREMFAEMARAWRRLAARLDSTKALTENGVSPQAQLDEQQSGSETDT